MNVATINIHEYATFHMAKKFAKKENNFYDTRF